MAVGCSAQSKSHTIAREKIEQTLVVLAVVVETNVEGGYTVALKQPLGFTAMQSLKTSWNQHGPPQNNNGHTIYRLLLLTNCNYALMKDISFHEDQNKGMTQKCLVVLVALSSFPHQNTLWFHFAKPIQN